MNPELLLSGGAVVVISVAFGFYLGRVAGIARAVKLLAELAEAARLGQRHRESSTLLRAARWLGVYGTEGEVAYYERLAAGEEERP